MTGKSEKSNSPPGEFSWGQKKRCQRWRSSTCLSVQQKLYTTVTADEYIKQQGHRKVNAPERCPGCGHRKLHRHGSYRRHLVELGKLYAIKVARFICPGCAQTTSCLPSFALPYRLLSPTMVEAFLLGKREEPGIAQHRDLLEAYQRRWEQRAPGIVAITGRYFGYADARTHPGDRLLRGLLDKWATFERASVELLERFGESPLGVYRVHTWARVARGSVDPLRKPPRLDSS